MSPTQVNSEVQGAQAQGAALQNYYNTQANGLSADYQAQRAQANNAQSDLSNYSKQIAGTNYGDVYGQDLQSAQSMYGFDPTQLLKANMALANTNTTLANLPQAVQQQGNYYGTTAGQQAGNYANTASNLNGVLAGQSNTVNAYQNILAATQNQANQQTTQQLAGQGQALQGFQSAAQNASQIMQTAGTTLAQIEGLQQQQGYLTAEQTAAYQNAYSQYVQAQAAQTSAAAAMTTAGATAGLYGIQGQSIQQQMALAQQANSQATAKGGLSVGSASPGSLGAGTGIKLQ